MAAPTVGYYPTLGLDTSEPIGADYATYVIKDCSGPATIEVRFPSTVDDNSLALLFVSTGSTTLDLLTASGWTQIATPNFEQSSSGIAKANVLWKRVSSSDAGTAVAVSFDTSSNNSSTVRWGAIVTVTGALSSGDPIEGVDRNRSSTDPLTSPATTTSGADRLMFRFWSKHSTDAGASWTVDDITGWTEILSTYSTGGTDNASAIDYRVASAADTYAATTRSTSSNGVAAQCITFAVIPDSGASAVAGISRHYARMMTG